VSHTSTVDIQAAIAKLTQLRTIGCVDYAILWDDIQPTLSEEDKKVYSSVAQAQCCFTNEVLKALELSESKDSKPQLFLFCPTAYCEIMADGDVSKHDYLSCVGDNLAKNIHVLWTGKEIIDKETTVEDMRKLRKVIKRKPMLWDNFYANDYAIDRLFLGPFAHRDSAIKDEIAGLLINPNCQFVANYVPICTLGAWASTSDYSPEAALDKALDSWLPHFASSVPKKQITKEDLVLLVSLFYLPHNESKLVNDFLASAKFLLGTSNYTSKDTVTKLDAFVALCKRIRALFDKMGYLKDRELLYSMYRYLWNAAEEADILAEYVQARAKEGKSVKFSTKFHRPGPYRGGFLRRLESLLVYKPDATFVPAQTLNQFEIINYEPKYEDDAYNVCLKTADSGDDGTHLFPNDPKIIGHRYVGPYIVMSSKFAFLLKDDQGVCGYVLGALDSKDFYQKMHDTWLPKLRKMYKEPKEDDTSEAGGLIRSFYNPVFFFPDLLQNTYPSHMHIDLLPRAQGCGNGTAMITKLLFALMGAGSPGVHLEMASNNARALRFYKKIGFKELCRYHDDGKPASKDDNESHTICMGIVLGKPTK